MGLQFIVKVMDSFLGLKNTSYQLYDSHQLDLKYLVHIALKINTLNFPVQLWTSNLFLKVLISKMNVHTLLV